MNIGERVKVVGKPQHYSSAVVGDLGEVIGSNDKRLSKNQKDILNLFSKRFPQTGRSIVLLDNGMVQRLDNEDLELITE